MTNYSEAYHESNASPQSFWAAQARRIAWYHQPKNILSTTDNGFYRWFTDGVLNTCYLAVDRHIEEGNGQQVALIYDSPVSGRQQRFTYSQLKAEVSRLAGALRQAGVTKGDRVVIYMPVVPEAVFSMLACARIGAIHSVVFGGFAPHELAIRINDAKPKVVLTANYGLEVDKKIAYKPLVDEAIAQAIFKPGKVVVLLREGLQAEMMKDRDVLWEDFIAKAPLVDCVPVESGHPLYILYTSGTTGKPKGIVRDHGGHAVALAYSMETIYGTKPGDVFWAASDVGWVVGHSYMVYGPLITGCTTVLYEGKPVRTPDAGAFWRVIEEHQVKVLFTAPTAIRAIKKEDPELKLLKSYNVNSLERLYLAGERCDVDTWHWANHGLQVPVIDHWWQTESGWPIVAQFPGLGLLEPKAGSAGFPVPGFQVDILNEAGEVLIPAQEGYVAIKLPLPPGCLPTLFEDDERFRSSYLDRFPGYYLTGDGGYKDEDNHVFIMGRIDDVINVAGHRLSTGEMEEMVAKHPAVAECAVVGMADEMKGQLPLALVVLKDQAKIDDQTLENELVQVIRSNIGAVACFKQAIVVQRLPKTRSGKILRRIIRHIADGTHYAVPSTIDDPHILTEIHDALKNRLIGQAFLHQ